MVESFLIALATLLIALYVQARRAAEEIRRNREQSGTTMMFEGSDSADARVSSRTGDMSRFSGLPMRGAPRGSGPPFRDAQIGSGSSRRRTVPAAGDRRSQGDAHRANCREQLTAPISSVERSASPEKTRAL